MTTTREYLIQAVREVAIALLTLTDAQVIPSDDAGPRPALPYLTVEVQSGGRILGHETVHGTSGANATARQRAWRVTTATVRGFGRDAEEWLELLTLRLGGQAALTATTAQGVTLSPAGPVLGVSVTRETTREEQSVLELDVTYQVTDATAETAGELQTVQVAATLDRYSGDPSPIETTATVTL